MNESEPVGVVGLGIIGSAISRNLVAAGTGVYGHDPSEDASARATANGVETRGSVEEVAGEAGIVFTSLPSIAAVRQVVASLCASFKRPGSIIVEMSTVDLADKLALADAVAEAGHVLIDCPVSGTGAQAQAKDIVLYASGDESAIGRLRPITTRFARQLIDLGPVGNGTRVKLVANLLVAIHNVATAEAMLLGQRAGIDPQRLIEAISAGAGTSRIFELRAPMMAADHYAPPTMKLSVWGKDMVAIARLAAETGTPTPLFDRTGPLYDASTLDGPELDTAAVLRSLAALPRDPTQ